MRIRRILAAAVLAVGVLAPTVASIPGTATAAPGKSAKAKPAKTVKPKPAKAVKPPKAVQFSASGVLTAVDAAGSTVTVTVKSGTPDVRGKTVTFTITGKARVRLDETATTVAGLQAGYHASISGTRLGTAYTVLKLNADAPEPTPSVEPTEPADEPTDEPTP